MEVEEFKRRLRARPVMHYYTREKRWEITVSFDDHLIAKNAGFFWHAKNRAWCTTSAKRAVKLIRYASVGTRDHLLSIFAARPAWD